MAERDTYYNDGNGLTEESSLLDNESNATGESYGPAGDVVKPVNGISDEESQGHLPDKRGHNVIRIISVLLIGILVAHADGSIMLATSPTIASEFNELANAAWLVTSFALAGAATQTLYGKLSDIYGRRLIVIAAYLFVVLGCVMVGIGQTMWQVILGRVISGAGTSGMTALVSVLITDLLPLRDVAPWRAYVNVVATTGRSIGGPLGGWLADAVGWRWSFLGQAPILGVAIILCAIYLPGPPPHAHGELNSAKFSRIDFRGSFVFAAMILSLLLPIELGGSQFRWTHPLIPSLFTLSGVLLIVFIIVERREKEPILPLEIFQRRDAVLSFLVMGFQTAAQISMIFSVPLYFQVTGGLSNTESGLHLVPAVVGNAVGGLLSGIIIKRTGKYKFLTLLAVTFSSTSYLLLMARWHGHTSWPESLYIIPSGFGTGIAQSALFISLQVVIDPAHLAPAVSFMYLSTTVWMTIGLPVSNAVMGVSLRKNLEGRLVGLGLDRAAILQILNGAISDVSYVHRIAGPVHTAIVDSYVDALWWSHGVSFSFSFSALIMALFLEQRQLDT